MPAKPKTKPRLPRLRERALGHVRRHPLITWGTAASIIAVAGGLWTGGSWFFARFQLVEAAELHAKEDARIHAEARYEIQSVKSLILGNRVIACRNRTRSLASPAPDAATCAQAEQDYKLSTDRERDLYRETLKQSK